MPRTGAEKMLDYRRRKREQGLRLVQLWAFDRGSAGVPASGCGARPSWCAGHASTRRGERVPGRAARTGSWPSSEAEERLSPRRGDVVLVRCAAQRAVSSCGPTGARRAERGDRRGRLRQRRRLPDHRLLDPRRRVPGRDRGLVGDRAWSGRPRSWSRRSRRSRGRRSGRRSGRRMPGRCSRWTGRCCCCLISLEDRPMAGATHRLAMLEPYRQGA